MAQSKIADLLVIGGGINGCGIAADASGRGLSVILAEMNDLASATSSASSKLIHGGLRYLEHYDFRLVREALSEREILLRKAPHIIWPLRFVLPHVRGLRPRWMIRAGLFLYDHLARRRLIPGSSGVDLRRDPAGEALKPELTAGFAYFDCWVDDARLVLLNAQAAAARGAEILTRTRLRSLVRIDGEWQASLLSGNVERIVRARHVVNAAGPWVDRIDGLAAGAVANVRPAHVRLVKGSHIVVPRVAGTHGNAYLMQNADGRVVFALPYEDRFTIVGTTDLPFDGDPAAVAISADEERYLLELANRFFKVSLRSADIVWRYSGVRPLYDDGDANPSAVTRDYRLELRTQPDEPQMLSCYGGKVTTYRCLAEDALEKLRPALPHMGPAWTANAPLPGGDIPNADFKGYLKDLQAARPGFDGETLHKIARRHGTGTGAVLGDARRIEDLGAHLGAGLTEREVLHMKHNEWARTADDILWRRTKAGLHLDDVARARAAAAIERLLAG